MAFLPVGDSAVVLCCNTRDPELEKRLTAMGIGCGAVVEIVGNENGRVMVLAGDTRLGIDADLARRIRVVPARDAWDECRRFRRRRRRGAGDAVAPETDMDAMKWKKGETRCK